MRPVLVLQHTENQRDISRSAGLRPGSLEFTFQRVAGQRFAQNFRAGNIVRAVEQNVLAGFCLDQLQPARPVYRFQTGANRRVVHGDFTLQHLNRRQCEAALSLWWLPGKGRAGVSPVPDFFFPQMETGWKPVLL